MEPEESSSSELWQSISSVITEVQKGDTDPEKKALTWRIAESQERKDLIEQIKNSVEDNSIDRFEMAYYFFTTVFETEGDLETEGIPLTPVSQKTVDYMIEGLLSGVEIVKSNNEPEILLHRLKSIEDILKLASDSPDSLASIDTDRLLGSTYLKSGDVSDLCEKLNTLALFGFAYRMTKGVENGDKIFLKQKTVLTKILKMADAVKNN